MAAVLESLTIPRVSAAVPSAYLAPAAGPNASRRRSVRLSGSIGFEIQSLRSSPSLSSRSRFDRRRGRIVCEAQETAVEVAAVSDSTWETLVLKSDSPVLVEFWAPWCGPCRMIHPVVDKLAKKYAGKLKCYKVNTDESPLIATQYGVRSIPTIIIFKDGEKKDAVIGAVPESTLTTSIEKFL